MKVAHSAIVTPGRSGLYETTRELVASLRVFGVDSRLVDPDVEGKYGQHGLDEDRGVPIAGWDWAVDADVLVSHSGFDGTPGAETGQPVVLCCHGRPYNSMMIESESEGKKPIYSYMRRKNCDERVKAVVTFWPEHVDYHRVMFPDKPVHCVQAPVDLIEWCPGPARYDFSGLGGDVNVVYADTLRQDGGLWMPLNVFALWARENPGAKLHLYAIPKGGVGGYMALLRRIKEDGNLGEVRSYINNGLKEVYRAADMVITGNEIDTRTVREAMACGCPVVKVLDIKDANWMTVDTRNVVRKQAEKRFNPTVSAAQFKKILENL